MSISAGAGVVTLRVELRISSPEGEFLSEDIPEGAPYRSPGDYSLTLLLGGMASR